MMPIQNVGRETASSARMVHARSKVLFGRVPDRMPSGMPMRTARQIAVVASSNVDGSFEAINGRTGWLNLIDLPRSPWNARCTKLRYWTAIG